MYKFNFIVIFFFFFSSRRRHTRFDCDWSSDVCSSDLNVWEPVNAVAVSSPEATEVEREKLEGATTPEPPSVAVHVKETLAACQAVSEIGRASCRGRV